MGIDDILGGVKSKRYESATDREAAAKDLMEKCGYAAAALTAIPIPFITETVAVAPIHVGMVMGIGHIYEQPMTRETAEKLLLKIGATVGLSLIGTHIATTAAKLILPVFGGILISAPLMYASTQAIGMVARVYFESEGEVSDADMKAVYDQALKRAKSSFDPKRAKSTEAQELAKSAAKAAEADPRAQAVAKEAKAEARTEDPVGRLERLKALLDKGLIDAAEYETTKQRILKEI